MGADSKHDRNVICVKVEYCIEEPVPLVPPAAAAAAASQEKTTRDRTKRGHYTKSTVLVKLDANFLHNV